MRLDQEDSHLVDVLLPIRTPAPWLAETLQGLQEQTLTDWTLICTIHEDSLAVSSEISSRFQRVTIVPVSDQLKFPDVLNAGLRAGTGQYIARIDQDDIPLPRRLEKQLNFLEQNPEVAVVGTPVNVIDEKGHFIETSFRVRTRDIRRQLLIKNCIAHPSVMMRRATLDAIGGYAEAAINGEDYELWLRIAQIANIACLEEPLLDYRRHEGQMSKVGAMDSRGRSLVRRARLDLAGNSPLSQVRVGLLNALWSLVQIARELRRRKRPAGD